MNERKRSLRSQSRSRIEEYDGISQGPRHRIRLLEESPAIFDDSQQLILSEVEPVIINPIRNWTSEALLKIIKVE